MRENKRENPYSTPPVPEMGPGAKAGKLFSIWVAGTPALEPSLAAFEVCFSWELEPEAGAGN